MLAKTLAEAQSKLCFQPHSLFLEPHMFLPPKYTITSFLATVLRDMLGFWHND
jgi:hypothetical protein